MSGAVTIAIVGMGPRGLSVFERLAVYLRQRRALRPVRVVVIDDTAPGAGRVWRPDQARWLMMNTVVGELTMFSGRRDRGHCRPGAGCTFGEWAAGHPDPEVATLGPDDCAPRRVYGEYLEHVLDRVRHSLSGYAEVVTLVGRVTAVRDRGAHYVLELDRGGPVEAESVVLATGHARGGAGPAEHGLAEAARRHPGLVYLPGDSVADMRLDEIPANAAVGIVGIGLSFYDLLLSFSMGRGGVFERDGSGRLRYKQSGCEPRIVAGSRSGRPIATRGHNQKSHRSAAPQRFLTHAALARRRAAAAARHGASALDFRRDVEPLLHADINYVYLTGLARQIDEATERRLGAALLASPAPQWRAIAAAHGVEAELLDLDRLAHPFAGRAFAGPAEFRAALTELLHADLLAARQGNVDGPLKAALDVIRDSREVIRAAVEFGGLAADSYRHDFQAEVAPCLSLLSTGPPPVRLEQFLALYEADLIDVVGPATTFGFDPGTRRFVIESPQVPGSRRAVSVLIDGRVPVPHLRRNRDTLIRQLRRDGLVTEFVNVAGGGRHPTGGLHITPAENRVIAADRTVHRGLYAVGIPTENVRWFTQIGNGRPDRMTQFQREADAIAVSLMRATVQIEEAV